MKDKSCDILLETLETLVDEMQVVLSMGDPRPASWFISRIRRGREAIATVTLDERKGNMYD